MDGSALSTFSRGSRMSPKQRNGSGTMATTDPGATTDGPAEKGVFPLANGANGRERRSAGEGPPPGEGGGPRDTPPATNRIRSFMGKTPSAIKSKFLSVLGNSTEIINGISNKVSEQSFDRKVRETPGYVGKWSPTEMVSLISMSGHDWPHSQRDGLGHVA